MEIITAIRNTEEVGRLLYQVVGGYDNVPKHIELLSIIVRPDWQHKGIGSELVKSLVKIAKEDKISSIFVFVTNENKEFQEFMRKNDFIPDGKKTLWHQSWS